MSRIDASYIQKIQRVAVLLHKKWALEILCAMRQGPVRLSELKREIPLASKKALTARLRALQTAGIVTRRDLSSSVLRVEYAITTTTREPLFAILDDLAEWGSSSNPTIDIDTTPSPPK